MRGIPESIRKLADELQELPGIGPRQAIRLAFFVSTMGANQVKNLSRAVDELSRLKICERCFFVHQNPSTSSGQIKLSLCDICRDKNRKHDLIAVVEKETDLISLENTKKFNGRYLILGAIPKTGMLDDQQKLRLENLKSFIKKELMQGSPTSVGSRTSKNSGLAEEIILAFNPSSVGDFHASFLAKELAPFAKKISRLGIGLPTGGEIEFADDETLGGALERRG